MIDTCDQTLSKESRPEATRNEMNLRCLFTAANQVKKLISLSFGSTRISSRSYTWVFHGLERVSNVVSYCLAELSRATRAQEGIQLTPDNSKLALFSNQNRFPLDFRHAFTAIVPSETRISR